MESIKENVTAFRQWIVNSERKKTLYTKMLKQLNKYWAKLFSDPLPVVTPEGFDCYSREN